MKDEIESGMVVTFAGMGSALFDIHFMGTVTPGQLAALIAFLDVQIKEMWKEEMRQLAEAEERRQKIIKPL